MKLGDHTVVLEKSVPTGKRDAYGKPVVQKQWRELRWVSFTPARSTEPNDRTSPAIMGGTLLVSSRDATDVEGADAILSPWTKDDSGTYTGTRWEIVGDVGRWDEVAECLLRRLA